jgi:nucleoside-diphosphate-sugar epimerase
MRTLITGASGFIGQHLLQHRLTGEIHILKKQSSVNKVHGVTHHYGDLRDSATLKELASLRFDRLIHLAWSGLPDLTRGNNRENLEMSKNLISAFTNAGVNEINVVGSCLEYGDLEKIVSEDDVGTNISEFGNTKLELLDYLSKNQPNYRWMRIFYAYGPNQHANSLLRQGYLQAKRGKTLSMANPALSKDFIYVGDVASAITALINKKSEYGIYNIGSGISTSIGQMINLVYEQMGLPSERFEEDLISLRASTRKLSDACGWTPTTNVRSGVRNTVKWMIDNNV